MNLEQKVLRRINQDDIRMKPRWSFYAEDISRIAIAFVLMAFSALFCGVAIALGIHWTSEISWVNFPYNLIVLSLIMAFLAYESFVRAFSFYKIRFSVAMLTLFLTAVFFGYLLFAFGHAEKLERKLQHFSVYQKIIPVTAIEYETYEGFE